MRGQQDAGPSAEPARGWRWFPEDGPLRTAFEAVFIVSAYVLYQLVRGTVQDRTAEAFQRAAKLIDIERALGIFWEAELQALILTWDVAVRAANLVYVWGHLPMIIAVAVWLYAFHRHRYVLFRNAFLISGGIGLILFWLLPTAPPRFLAYWGFVDTTVEATSYYVFQNPAFVNQYAAMPSLHFGWSVLVALALFLSLRPPYRYLALGLPVVTLGGIVLTANHFFLDAVAGAAVAFAGLGIALLLRAYLPRYKPFSVLT